MAASAPEPLVRRKSPSCFSCEMADAIAIGTISAATTQPTIDIDFMAIPLESDPLVAARHLSAPVCEITCHAAKNDESPRLRRPSIGGPGCRSTNCDGGCNDFDDAW